MVVNKHFGTANPVDLEVDVLLVVLTSGMLIKLLRSENMNPLGAYFINQSHNLGKLTLVNASF